MSIAEDWPDPDKRNRDEEPRKKMSLTTKIFIGLGAMFGICLLVCCGAGGWFVYNFQKGISKDPVVVRAAAQQMAEFDLPADFEPEATMDLFGVMKMVIFTNHKTTPAGQLLLMSMNIPGASAQDVERGFQQNHNKDQNVRELKSELKDVTIKGSTHKFKFAEAELPDQGNAKVRLVSGTFPGKSSPAFFYYIVPESEYDEDEVLQVLGSIK